VESYEAIQHNIIAMFDAERSVDQRSEQVIVSVRIRTGGLRMMESPRQFLMTSIILIGMVIVIGYFL
jgi:hypothetical protein